jgi:phosphatidylglycerophosphatase C
LLLASRRLPADGRDRDPATRSGLRARGRYGRSTVCRQSMTTPAIAAFDFDGTLTTRDTLLRLVAVRRGRVKFGLDLVETLPLLILYAAGRVGNEVHKMALFARAFAGMGADAFAVCARDFARTELPGMLRSEALRRVRFHQARGDRVVIVTASPTDWILPWAEDHAIDEVIGNHAEVSAGRVTGRLSGPNCYGPEKLRRLLARLPDRNAYTLFAYGDSRGDQELLAAADHAFYRCFE